MPAPDQFQYIKLPDGSYGKFRADASDADIRTAITKDFPTAFTGQANPPAQAMPEGTISAYHPGLLERAERTLPVLDRIRRGLSGPAQTDAEALAKPSPGMLDERAVAPEQFMSPSQQQAHPILTGTGEVAGGLTTPENLLLAAGMPVTGPLARPIGGLFSAQMAKGVADEYPQFRQAQGSEKLRLGTHMVLGSALAALGLKHALTGGVESSTGVPESKTETAETPMPQVEQAAPPPKPPVYPPEVKAAIRTVKAAAKKLPIEQPKPEPAPVEAAAPKPLEPSEVIPPPKAEPVAPPPKPPAEEIRMGKNGKPIAPRQESAEPRKSYPNGEDRAATALKDWKAAEAERSKLEGMVQRGQRNDPATKGRIEQLKQRQSMAMRNWGQYANSVDVEKAVGQYEARASQTLDKLDQLSQHINNYRAGKPDIENLNKLVGRQKTPVPFTDTGTQFFGKYIKSWSDSAQADIDKAELLKRAKGIKETELGQQIKARLLNLPKEASDALRLGGTTTEVRPSPKVEQAAPVAAAAGPIAAKGSKVAPVEEQIKYDKNTLPTIKFANKTRAAALAEQVFGKDNYILKTLETAGGKRSYQVVAQTLPKEIRDAVKTVAKASPIPQEAPRPTPQREAPKPAPVQAPPAQKPSPMEMKLPRDFEEMPGTDQEMRQQEYQRRLEEARKKNAKAKPVSGVSQVERPAEAARSEGPAVAKPIATPAAAPATREPVQTTPKSQVGVPVDQAQDGLFQRALALAKEQGQVGVSDLKQKLDISGGQAIKLIDRLEAEGHIAAAEKPSAPRKYVGDKTPLAPQMPTEVQEAVRTLQGKSAPEGKPLDYGTIYQVYSQLRHGEKPNPDLLRETRSTTGARDLDELGRWLHANQPMPEEAEPSGEAKGSSVQKTLGAKPSFMKGPGEANPERGSFIFGNAKTPSGTTNPISRLGAKLNEVLNKSAARELTEDIIRKRGGTLAREKEIMVAQLADHIARHDSDGEDQLRAFMDAGEGRPGATFLNAQDQGIAQELHQMFQERWNHLKQLKPDRFKGAGIDNYLKHLFKGPSSQNIAQRILFGKRPLEGPATFTRHRFYEYLSDAMDQGAEPVTYNPIRMQLMGLYEIDRYIMAHEIKADLQSRGLVQFFKLGAKGKGNIPPGWSRIDDKIFQPRALSKGGLTSYGEFWAPGDVAKTFNNFLSPGLRGKLPYDVVRNYGNLLNQIQLNFSAFHATFTTVNAAISDMALGLQKMVGGDLGGLKNVGRSFSVAGSAKRYYDMGKMLEQEYVTPGTRPGMAGLAKAVEIAGGRIGVDPFYEDAHIDKFRSAWNNHKYVQSVFRAPLAAAEYSSHWLMKYMVPRMKLGMFADTAQWKLGEMIKSGATQDAINHELGRIWDSVDNRAGQLVYDNLFWNKTLKDLGMLSVRSLGWNIGTMRELGGGISDIGRQVGRVARGEKPELTYKMAYTMSLPVIAGFIGATMGYLATGHMPRTVEDYFFPQTGKLDAQGKPERLSIPSYMRDVWAFSHAPATTVVHKLHPFFEQLYDMYHNQDFYGTEIYHPDDPAVKSAWNIAKYLGKGFTPLGWQNAMRRAQVEHGDDSLLAPLRPGALGSTLASGFGFTPAPAYVGASKADELSYEFAQRHYQQGPRTGDDFQRHQAATYIRNRLAQGELTGEELSHAINTGKVTMDQVTNMLGEQNMSPLERRFATLSPNEALAVWREATPNERSQLRPMFLDKFSSLDPIRDADLMNRYQTALQ